MNDKKRWVMAAIAALVVVTVIVAMRAAQRTRLRNDGSCHEIATAAGVGDISVDSARGIAYLAYLDRTANAEGKQPVGTVMLVDLNAKEPHVRAALATDPQNFRPLALSVYAPAEGPRRLFVIDAGDGVLAVQVFEQSATGAFTLVQTLHDSRIVNPSAIVASGPNQFYIVSSQPWWRLGGKSVAYFNGQTSSAPSDDKATEIAAATSLAREERVDAAARYGKRVLLGSLTERKLLLCERTE